MGETVVGQIEIQIQDRTTSSHQFGIFWLMK